MALARIDELVARLGPEYPLTDPMIPGQDLTTVATNVLEDLSTDAVFYGSSSWTSDNVPAVVKSIVLRAAVRYMKNPDGFMQSRAGDETVQWNADGDDMAGSAHFSDSEIAQLEKIASGTGLPSLVTVGTYAWNDGTGPRLPQHYYQDWGNIL